jgi:L-glyceraldehyde 3-phosphate reductase
MRARRAAFQIVFSSMLDTSRGMERRRLGRSDLQVTRLALGSWRTFERIPRERGAEVMRAAREAGIAFLDDARYNDETGRAPIPTGYSEVVFGELFRAAGWVRDEVVVANKLWWEFWPDQTAEQEIDGSLGRMGLDHIDLIYAERLPDGLSVQDAVRAVAALVSAGKARAWGVLNWPAARIAEAAAFAAAESLPGPCAVQLPYSLVRRSPVEDPDVVAALRDGGVSVVASAVMEGGALTGRGSLRDDRATDEMRREGARVREVAGELGVPAAALAIAFALANPDVASVLFGASRPEQIAENIAALDVTAEQLDRAVGHGPAGG